MVLLHQTLSTTSVNLTNTLGSESLILDFYHWTYGKDDGYDMSKHIERPQHGHFNLGPVKALKIIVLYQTHLTDGPSVRGRWIWPKSDEMTANLTKLLYVYFQKLQATAKIINEKSTYFVITFKCISLWFQPKLKSISIIHCDMYKTVQMNSNKNSVWKYK